MLKTRFYLTLLSSCQISVRLMPCPSAPPCLHVKKHCSGRRCSKGSRVWWWPPKRRDFIVFKTIFWRVFPYPCISMCEECISGSMRYITSSYMAIAFGSRPPWSSLHGLGEDSTASLTIRVLRPKREWFRLRCSLHHKSCIETKYLRVYRVVLYHLTPSLAGIELFAGYQPYLAYD